MKQSFFSVKSFGECNPETLRPFIGERDVSTLHNHFAVYGGSRLVGIFDYILRSSSEHSAYGDEESRFQDVVVNLHVTGAYLQLDRFRSFVDYVRTYLSKTHPECRYIVSCVDWRNRPICQLFEALGESPSYDYDELNEVNGRSFYLKPVNRR